MISLMKMKTERVLTMVESINVSTERDLVSCNDASKHSQKTAGDPPANGVTNKVNLLTRIILSPEAHSAKQEWPVVRLAGVRMAAGQLVVVVEHGPLQLKPLAEEGQ